MATLEKIRNRAGLLIGIVIGMALLAFVLGDLFKQGGQAFRGNRLEIAEINGESINYNHFQQEVEELSNINKFSQGKSSLTEETRQRIREQVWQRLTREYVMADVYDELGIDVSSEELWDMVQGENIHPMIRQIFTNPETGELNTLAIIRFLKSYEQDPSGQRKAYWLFLEDQMVRERKFTKFSNLVTKGMHITSREAEQFAALNSKQVDINYVVQRFNSVSDSAISISDSDLKAYYDKHKANYKQSASRDIEYVSFDIEPTAQDRKEAQEWIQGMIEDFARTQEPREFVNLNSDVSFNDNYRKQEELSDSISDLMFSNEEGYIYGPYFENEMFKISKLVDVKYLPDSVKVSHILIQPNRRTRNVQQAKALADSLTTVLQSGGNFASLARQFSDDQQTAGEGGNLGWISKGQYYESVIDSALFSQKGAVKQVQAQDGFHIIKVEDKGRAVKKVQVATLARRLEPSSETYQQVYSTASKFAGKNNTYEDFLEAIEEEGLTKRMANSIQLNSKSIPGLQDARNLIRAAFEAKEDEIITSNNNPIFEINDQFIIGFVTEVRKEGTAPLDEVKEDVRLKVKEQKKADQIATSIQEQLNNAGSITNLADNLGLRVRQAPSVNYSTMRIPGAGAEPKVAGAAVALEKGKLSYPIQGENGVYVIEVTNINENMMDPELYKQREMQNIQRTATFQAYEALKEEADIKDKRYKFY